MGWLSSIFETLKDFPEITIPMTLVAILFFIGLSLLKTWRTVKVAKIGADNIKKSAKEMQTKFEQHFQKLNNDLEYARKKIDEQARQLFAFTDVILEAYEDSALKAQFDERLGRLASYVPVESALIKNIEELPSVLTIRKKKIKKRKAGK